MGRGLVVAAVSSGSGKTTVTNGIIRALSRRNMRVAPFKVGPDYIDTHYHRIAAGRNSINLDLFMSGGNHVRSLFYKHTADSDMAIVEGVMGLFDGYDKEKGSASHIAKILNLPVVLLINAASSAYSLAAVLTGFRMFDPEIKIAGVIFNNVTSDNHLRLLRDAAGDARVKYLGHIRRNKELVVPSRHLGLSLGDDKVIDDFIDKAADAVEQGVFLNELIESVSNQGITDSDNEISDIKSECRHCQNGANINEEGIIAVAHDEAFNFIYPENIQALKFLRLFNGRPMRIVEFSPIHDISIPDADFLYLPGGYPELYMDELSANIPMRDSIRRFVETGEYTLAECGGMLYLGENIDGADMCGVFPVEATMKEAKLRLGYRTLDFNDFEIKGHEFHYSRVIEKKPIASIAMQYDVKGNMVTTPVYKYKNCVAGYTHLYWADNDISKLWRKGD